MPQRPTTCKQLHGAMETSIPIDDNAQEELMESNKNVDEPNALTKLQRIHEQETNKDQHNHENMGQKALVEAVSKKLLQQIEEGLIPQHSNFATNIERATKQTPE